MHQTGAFLLLGLHNIWFMQFTFAYKFLIPHEKQQTLIAYPHRNLIVTGIKALQIEFCMTFAYLNFFKPAFLSK